MAMLVVRVMVSIVAITAAISMTLAVAIALTMTVTMAMNLSIVIAIVDRLAAANKKSCIQDCLRNKDKISRKVKIRLNRQILRNISLRICPVDRWSES